MRLEHQGKRPHIHESAYIAPTAYSFYRIEMTDSEAKVFKMVSVAYL